MEAGCTTLATSLPGELGKFSLTKPVLCCLCQEKGLRAGNKPDLLSKLEKWVGDHIAPSCSYLPLTLLLVDWVV
jgi:hypothetical protein